ncbi:MAG TPA: PAS domain-containing sensor histidine kinase [Puia sp.]|nr:PAS domain-containing sensor histidine kinase [Puia sp.]
MGTGSLVAGDESGFKALFTHATVGILIVDRSGSITHANPFACRMLGYDEEAFIGQDISILIPEELRSRHKAHIHSYFRSPVSRPMGQGMELTAVKKDGERLYVEISLCSYSLDEERSAVAFITDITRQKLEAQKLQQYRENLEALVNQRTEELNSALEREKQIGQAKSHFVSLASHEFRTPLSTILSSTSLICRYNENIRSDNIDKHTSRIKASVMSMTHILNDFLSLDKLEQGAVRVNPEPFHLAQVLTEWMDELELYLKPGQTITHAHTGEQMVHTDKNILKNILLNLLSNASKYSGENKPILVKTRTDNGILRAEVIDQGIGIPEKEVEKLFSLFYRGTNVGSIKGTGLGLNIVSQYVSLLGGKITVSTIENTGTTLTILLPPLTDQ